MLPAAVKERSARRYLSICDLAKRDPERAAARLEAFLEALEELHPEAPDTPREGENTLGD
uniref:Uncharacterized protein n=2 Tax=Nonomuraea gerenzanensis TaxID=93944 RepID=A0A1M4ENI3_9ACTN|nr:hypothetical protein BN4615_P9927 [Nonomuraea gerenzanensis]